MPEKNTAPLAAFPTLTTEMIEQFKHFTGYINPGEFRDQLIGLYFHYVINNPEVYPDNFAETTESLYLFLEFLTDLQAAMDNKK